MRAKVQAIISQHEFEVVYPVSEGVYKGFVMSIKDDFILLYSPTTTSQQPFNKPFIKHFLIGIVAVLAISLILSFISASWHNLERGCRITRFYFFGLVSGPYYACNTGFDVNLNLISKLFNLFNSYKNILIGRCVYLIQSFWHGLFSF